MPRRKKTPQATPDAPKLVGDRYAVGAPLGRGGMATVYRGHDEQLGRPVAVKIMRSELGEDRKFVQRFEVEARRAASVTHPNVVSVYDVGTDGAPYMVMELIENGDLAKTLAREGPMAADRAARIASEVAAALQAAHEAGLVHRDVKPGNILLGADGHARVADFGIARATGEASMTKTGAIMGSVEYFSPEQARGEQATAASDIYALGVVLFELLTGTRPFTGDSPYAVATARLNAPPPDPRHVRPDVPDGLAEITMRAMSLEPDARFGSAAELRAALDAWQPVASPHDTAALLIPPSAAPAAPAAAAPVKRRERRRVPVWGVALALLLLAAGGYAGARLLDGGVEEVANPFEVIVGDPDGDVESTPSPTPTSEPTASPTTEPTPSPTPVVAAATPAPTAVPAAPPAATPAPVAVAGPQDAVAAFYRNVERGSFDAAYALWSDRMKATYPRQENLDGRFANTASIVFSELRVFSQSANAATVQANFTETYDSGSSRSFTGYWRLVRVNGTWLLDDPTY